jgi:RecG-like helicase
LPRKERDSVASDIKKGAVDIVIGTHALLEEYVQFKNLGLVIIDEQHRFGVGQRSLLPQKGRNPDVLIMTATPIPRTLAITLYGDLDVSVIERMPPGRKPVKTKLITGERRPWMYDFMKEQVRSGRRRTCISLDRSIAAADLLSAERCMTSSGSGIRDFGRFDTRPDEQSIRTWRCRSSSRYTV